MDIFGIAHLYPTNPDVREWNSKYWEGKNYNLLSTQVDPLNPIVRKRGNGGFVVNDGELILSGSVPRIYVNNNWKSTEVTVFYKRIGTDGKSSQGIVIGHRSLAAGHTSRSNNQVHTYYTKYSHPGKTSIYKEDYHNSVNGKRKQWAGSKSKRGKYQKYSDILPSDEWIGVKSICFDVPNGNVRIELWLDEVSKGSVQLFNKNNWKLIDWFDDDGSNFGDANFYGMSGSCLIRNGGIKESRYKFFSIREIMPQNNNDLKEESKITLTNKGNSNLVIKPNESIDLIYNKL